MSSFESNHDSIGEDLGPGSGHTPVMTLPRQSQLAVLVPVNLSRGRSTSLPEEALPEIPPLLRYRGRRNEGPLSGGSPQLFKVSLFLSNYVVGQNVAFHAMPADRTSTYICL